MECKNNEYLLSIYIDTPNKTITYEFSIEYMEIRKTYMFKLHFSAANKTLSEIG